MAIEYHLIIEWTGDTYKLRYGLPSEHGLAATVADEFTLGTQKCIVWQVICILTLQGKKHLARLSKFSSPDYMPVNDTQSTTEMLRAALDFSPFIWAQFVQVNCTFGFSNKI